MTIDAAEVARVLGGEAVLRQRVVSLADLQRVVSAGLPLRALDETVRYEAGAGRSATALKDLLVPRATRSRRTRLKLEESERVERLARVIALSEAVWENREDALAFLNEPHPMLEGSTPVEMAATELGARRVERLLMQLEFSLLNPQHPEYALVRFESPMPMAWDARFSASEIHESKGCSGRFCRETNNRVPRGAFISRAAISRTRLCRDSGSRRLSALIQPLRCPLETPQG